MNTLTILCLAVAVVCTSGQLVAYPGMYSYPGVLGAYPGLLPPATPITYKAGNPNTITLKTVAPSPITLKTVAPSPITWPHHLAPSLGAVSPVTYNVAPVAPVASVAPVGSFAPVHSRFHAQDELGQYSFGYTGGSSSRAETRDVFGNVNGFFNYVDAEGKVQTQHYVADGLGFRVSATNLPVAPEAPKAPVLTAPVPVKDTVEVAAAKETFRALFEKATAPESDSKPAETISEAPSETISESVSGDTVSRKKRSVVIPTAYPFGFSYGSPVPLTYSHPALTYSAAFPGVTAYTGFPTATTYGAAPAAAKDATLLRVVHNPGHAVSYRVD